MKFNKFLAYIMSATFSCSMYAGPITWSDELKFKGVILKSPKQSQPVIVKENFVEIEKKTVQLQPDKTSFNMKGKITVTENLDKYQMKSLFFSGIDLQTWRHNEVKSITSDVLDKNSIEPLGEIKLKFHMQEKVHNTNALTQVNDISESRSLLIKSLDHAEISFLNETEPEYWVVILPIELTLH